MAGWKFELTIISASNLPDVREFGRMKVYAEVSINEDADSTWKTPVDYDRETNPYWNVKTPYVLPEGYVQGADMVVIKLYCERSFLEDKYVGELKLYLKTLFEDRESDNKCEEYYVNRVNENGHFGVLKISYRFDRRVPENSIVIVKESSDLSKVLKAGTSIIVNQFVAAVAESIIPGSSVIFE